MKKIFFFFAVLFFGFGIAQYPSAEKIEKAKAFLDSAKQTDNRVEKRRFIDSAKANFGQNPNELNNGEFIVLDSLEGAEKIYAFHSDIVLEKDASILVTEKIKVLAKGNNIRRGIFRSLPLRRNLNGKEFVVDYEVLSVKKNGVEEDYHFKNENGYKSIYVGNKEVLLTNGIYDYEIQYRAKNQVGFFENYDELYWNVNGNAWMFEVDQISAKITLPEGAKILQNKCYTGRYGSKENNCSVKVLNDNQIFWAAKNLRSEEGLSVAVGFNKGVIAPPPPPTFLEKFGILIAAILAFISVMIYYFRTWQKHGVDPQKPTVYPQFNVPQDLSPSSLGYIFNERYKSNFITAALVNLSIKGFVKISEKEDEGVLGFGKKKIYTISKLKESENTLPEEEKKILEYFFNDRENVKLDGEYKDYVEKAVKNFQNNLHFQHEKFINEGNNGTKLILPIIFVSVLYFVGIYFSYQNFPEISKTVVALFLYGIGLFVYLIVTFAVKEFGNIWKFLGFLPFLFMFSYFFSVVFSSGLTEDFNFNVCYIFIILSFIGLSIYAYLIKRPSEKKLESKSLIEGLKMYMNAAENEQLKFHNPPQMTPEVFEKFLPYAMVLGVDKIWGEKFANYLKSTSTEYQNSWYYGSTPHFSSSFGSTLNSSLGSSISSASTQPSSSSSGSSGGGGFSGGGGGGGGGGGW